MASDKQIPEYYGEGGRLSRKASDILAETAYAHDCENPELLMGWLNIADLAHCIMLTEEHVIPAESASVLLETLVELQEHTNEIPIRPELGDIYNCRDAWLRARIGEHAGWLHAGRPRREAVNVAFLLALRDSLCAFSSDLADLGLTLCNLAEKFRDTVMPDYTYLQQAQPTSFGHYLLTFAFPVQRDLERLRMAYTHLDNCPAGSGSVNGSRLPLNRERLRELLGFGSIARHTRDAMWQPDLPIEVISAITTAMVNLARLAEELQIFCSTEFSMVELPDDLCRASVIMPQKKNPYPLTYIRGLANSTLGKISSYAALGRTFSGNPDSRTFIYNDILLTVHKSCGGVRLFERVLKGLGVREENMRSNLRKGFSQATDIADYLMQTNGMDYRTAHQVVGCSIRLAMEEKGDSSFSLSAEHLDAGARQILGTPLSIPVEVFEDLTQPSKILNNRNSLGGAAPMQVSGMATDLAQALESEARLVNDAMQHQHEATRNLLTVIANALIKKVR